MIRRLFAAWLAIAGLCVPACATEFGVVTKFDQGLITPDRTPLIAQVGVSINRDSIAWSEVEASKGALVWTPRYAKIFDALKAANVRSVVVLKRNNTLYDRGLFPTSPAAIAAFAKFAAFTAQKLQGQAIAFEIGNEWRPSPTVGRMTVAADYTNLFIAAANAIHAAVPGAKVIADPAIFANAPPTGVPAIGTPVGDMARRALAVADGVVVHQYPYQNIHLGIAGAQQFMTDQMKKRAVWLEALAGRPVPIWVTEFGWPQWAGKGITAARQAQLLSDTAQRLAAMPFVPVAIGFEMIDSCNNAALTECTFGLYHRDPKIGAVAKPALAAFRAVATGN